MRRILVVMLLFVLLAAETVSAKDPTVSVTQFKFYESSSTTLGDGTLICDLSAGGNCGPIAASTPHRVEIRTDETGSTTGTLNFADWADITNIWGSFDGSSACTYAIFEYPNTSAGTMDACSYSTGTLTLDDNTAPPGIGKSEFLWTAAVFTTAGSLSDAIGTTARGSLDTGAVTASMTGIDMVLTIPAEPLVLESWGKDNYGWEQVYAVSSDFTTTTRLTGSVDRRWFDWGHKSPQISGRIEDYWSFDSGWWYVSGGEKLNFTIIDGAGDTVLNEINRKTTKGRNTTTYFWNLTGDDDPGEWTASVLTNENRYNSTFKFFVRGMLNVSNITTNATDYLEVDVGENLTINATLFDHAGNVINGSHVLNNGTTGAAPTVMLYVTGGGENFNRTMVDGDADGNWSTTVVFNRPGDHKIIVAAYDGHNYWVDGRRSTWIYVNGTYTPDYSEFASPGLWLISFIDDVFRSKLLSLFPPIFGIIIVRRRGRYLGS